MRPRKRPSRASASAAKVPSTVAAAADSNAIASEMRAASSMARSSQERGIPADRPAAPHRHQPRGIERVDHQDHDRQIEEREPERERRDVEEREPAHLMVLPRSRRAPQVARTARSAPPAEHSSTIAMADATGQSLLAKNSIHKVWPIIIVSEPPSRSGMTNSPTIGMKHSSAPAATPGSDSGSVTVQNAFQRRAAEIGRGFEQGRIDLLQRRVERQHHERQVRIDEADIDRRVGREPRDRRVDDAERHQHAVEQTVVLQDGDPGIDADQERGPERQDHQQARETPAARAGARAMP